jgi:hypothetical protein
MNKNRFPLWLCLQSVILVLGAASVSAADPKTEKPAAVAPAKADPGLPYVYTKWEQITTKEGLPNDHIFAIKADPIRNCVWIGTEDGLACYDKKTKQIKTWKEKDG